MHTHFNRREFLRSSAAVGLATVAARAAWADQEPPLFKISLAEYSLHRMIAEAELDPLDFAPFAKSAFDIDAVEHWNWPFREKVNDERYLADMKKRADNAGVRSLLIMVDGEGDLGHPVPAERKKAVENHHKWVRAAKQLGCHSIRVNAQSKGSYEQQKKRAADGLRQLAEFAAPLKMNVIVENHGDLSSNGAWLSGVMKTVDLANCGTLPDFGNFYEYDRYQGVKELMPFAKAVSAKSKAFDAKGNETMVDYRRMMKIVVDAGYHGYVGIEWEGDDPSEIEGVKRTKELLERVRNELSA